MITFDLIQRIHRTIHQTPEGSARDEYVQMMNRMYPEAFNEVDITKDVRLTIEPQSGIEVFYRSKRIGKLTVKERKGYHFQCLSSVNVDFAKRKGEERIARMESNMDYGFAVKYNNYGMWIIMYGSKETYDLEFHPDKKRIGSRRPNEKD